MTHKKDHRCQVSIRPFSTNPFDHVACLEESFLTFHSDNNHLDITIHLCSISDPCGVIAECKSIGDTRTKQVTGNHRKFEFFLFDWDGCLVDTLPIWLEGMKHGLDLFNIDAPYEYIKRGFRSWDVFRDLGVTDMDLFGKEVNQYLHTHISNIKFNDGVPNLLKKLRANGLKSAIVSSAEEPRVLPVLKMLGATDFFECVITRYDVARLKPDPEPVEKAIHELRGQKEKTVIIGDSWVDVESGRNAGISTVWFSSHANQAYYLNDQASDPDPDMTIFHMSEVEELI